jgi:hypothetical protein
MAAAPTNPHGAMPPATPPAAPAPTGAAPAPTPPPPGPASAPANPHANVPGAPANLFGAPASQPSTGMGMGMGQVIPGQKPANAPQAGGGIALSGSVAEAHHVKQYTYLLVKEPSGAETWTAVLKDDSIKVGMNVKVGEEIWMNGFQSPSLNRTFDRILFGRMISKQ